MRRLRQFAAALVCVAIVGTVLAALAGAASVSNPLSGKKVGIIYLALDDPFYQAFQRGSEAWAKAHKVTLVEIDGQKNPQTMTSGVENLITQQVSGIIFSPIDAAAAVTPIKEAQAAHIPILVNSIHAAQGVSYPFVGQNEGAEEAVLGQAAAKLFHSRFGHAQAKIMIEGCPAATIVSTQRSDGFLQGWRSADPKAKVIAQLDGGCTQAGSVTAMENALQHLSVPNVLYGVNGIALIGGVQALQSAGHGKTDKQLMAFATDGAEQEIAFAAKHIKSTPLQLAAAISPAGLAALNFVTLSRVVSGKLSATADSNTFISESLLNYHNCSALKKWVAQDVVSKDKLPC